MEPGRDYSIRPIRKTDITRKFSTGNRAFTPLKTFLQKDAADFQKAMIAQTYVASLLSNHSDTGEVIGYITLTCSEIDIRNGHVIDDCARANRFDSMPAIKIARLAVDRNYGKIGIGTHLVQLALAIAIDVIAPATGCRFLTTDAKLASVEFYRKNAFLALEEDGAGLGDGRATVVMFLDLYREQSADIC